VATLVGIDTGGTYTDAVLFDQQDGVIARAKSLTTKHDLAIGVAGAVDAVLADADHDIELVAISTTLATNAIVEGQGSRVCLVLIGQRKDALDRSGLRDVLRGDPVVHIKGGHKADGTPVEALDIEALRESASAHAGEVSAFAVAGYFAVRNPEHEQAAREIIREVCDLPVTCSHELSSNLDAPRRALTAVLNARLIPLLDELIRVVHDLLASKQIQAPVMVVMGDGSLIASQAALNRPVETILSGPAASVIGARFLAQSLDAYVVDIGGTTTDIALLENGWPALNLDGAVVAGWRTMVQAVAVHTVGIGGDSEVRTGEGDVLQVGPRRAMPLSLLGHQNAEILNVLRGQLDRGYARTHDGRFAMRQRETDSMPVGLTTGEQRLWTVLEAGPLSVEKLMADHPLERQLERLINRGLVLVSAFTPSDAAHVLGVHDSWCTEAAVLGARLWARRDTISGWSPGDDIRRFSELVVESLLVQSGEAVIAAALHDQYGLDLSADQEVARSLIAQALKLDRSRALIKVDVTLDRPIIAIGAPASTYYPGVAERLGCEFEVPEHAEVCNAVGAVASGVMRQAKVTITCPSQGVFRLHFESGIEDFSELEVAVHSAKDKASGLARVRALEAGAADPEVRLAQDDVVADLGAGEQIFLESAVVATAVGRPRLSRD